MFPSNADRLLRELSPDATVLDVGGWACPFNRAQWILDAQPYETRGFYRTFGGPPSQGGDDEWFTRETWIQRDICDHTPWPFSDKQFDFAICSHTLEDLRDPIWVCQELVRVAKAGYIEVPSRVHESILGVERPGQAGLSHHRWLITISGSHVSFLQKYHMIHADWRFHLPARYRKRITPEDAVTWLWWEGSFSYEEVEIHGLAAQEAELQRFASRLYPRPAWLYGADRARREALSLVRRGRSWMSRRLGRGAA